MRVGFRLRNGRRGGDGEWRRDYLTLPFLMVTIFRNGVNYHEGGEERGRFDWPFGIIYFYGVHSKNPITNE